MAKTTQNSGRLPLLDGLRGLAAIAVMLYHVEVVFHDYGPFSRSYLFVDFFFLLSGFVLTLAAEDKMNAGLGTMGFMRARVKRLWPVIIAGALIGAVHAGLSQGWGDVAGPLVLAVLMIPAIMTPGQIFPLNGPQWSLMHELLANLVHGLLLRHLNEKGLVAVIVLSGAALAAVIFTFGSNTLGPFAHNWWYALPRVAFAYTLGVLAGRLWKAGSRAPTVSWELAFIAPPLAVVILTALPLSVAAGDTLFALFVLPGLFWIAASCTPPEAANAWLDRIGGLSFPLYAVHLPIIEFVAQFGQGRSMRILAIVSALIAAQLLASTLEGRRKRKQVRARPQPAQA